MTTDAQEVGGYRLLRRIGSGGMGTVHEAVDAEGRHVALKLLHPHIGSDPDARRRLAREVSLLHRVRDAGVARVLDAEVAGAEAFVVTELVEGPTLEDDVAQGGPFDHGELAALGHGLGEALEAIHAVGVLHRDLKPGNVMMSAHGPVLIDFGIAQVVDDARLTQTGMVTGTAGYLAPEVIDGAEPEAAGDWWAWAAVLTFAATGRPPFGRGPTAAVLARVTTGQVDTEGLPPTLARALQAALDPDPAQRLDRDGLLAVLDGTWDDAALTAVLGTAHAPDDTGSTTAGATTVLPGSDATPDAAGHPSAAYGVAGPVAHLPGAAGEQATRALPQVTGPPAGSDGTWAPSPVAPQPPWGGPPAGPQQPWAGPSAEPWGPPGLEQQPQPVPAWAVPARRRPLLVGAAGLALSAMAVHWPGALVVTLAALLVVLGTVGWAGRTRRATRMRRGVRRGDDARMYAALPWHLLRAALAALPGLVLGGLGALAVLWVGHRFLADYPDALPAVAEPVLLWGAGALAVVVAWLTPTSLAAREGARASIAAVLPSSTARTVLGLLLALVAVVVVLQLLGGAVPEPLWAPVPPPPV